MNYITNTQSDMKIMFKNMLIKVGHKYLNTSKKNPKFKRKLINNK